MRTMYNVNQLEYSKGWELHSVLSTKLTHKSILTPSRPSIVIELCSLIYVCRDSLILWLPPPRGYTCTSNHTAIHPYICISPSLYIALCMPNEKNRLLKQTTERWKPQSDENALNKLFQRLTNTTNQTLSTRPQNNKRKFKLPTIKFPVTTEMVSCVKWPRTICARANWFKATCCVRGRGRHIGIQYRHWPIHDRGMINWRVELGEYGFSTLELWEAAYLVGMETLFIWCCQMGKTSYIPLNNPRWWPGAESTHMLTLDPRLQRKPMSEIEPCQ